MNTQTLPLSTIRAIGFRTIIIREFGRIIRIWGQTLVPSAVTATLYFVIFGSLIGRRIGDMGGFAVLRGYDAATGFANNDLVQAEAAGLELSVFYASASAPFAGPGLISSPTTISAKGEAIRAFIRVTLDAMEQIAANPQLGVDAAAQVVPELIADAAASARALAVMEATIKIWRGPVQNEHGLGAIDRNGWAISMKFLQALPDQNVRADLTVDELINESLLP